MADKQGKSRTPKPETDEVILSYLSDLLGSEEIVLLEETAEFVPHSNAIAYDASLDQPEPVVSQNETSPKSNKSAVVLDAIVSGGAVSNETASEEIIVEELVEGHSVEQGSCNFNTKRKMQGNHALSSVSKHKYDEHIFVHDDSSLTEENRDGGLLPQERYGALETIPLKSALFSNDLVNTVRHLGSSYSPISSDRSMIPTFDSRCSATLGKYRKQSEALVFLLNSLYFLRRPLSPKLRETFLCSGERAIDDFHAAKYLAAMTLEDSGDE